VKVLHVHKITGVGGSERHLLTLLPALRAAGVDARFLGLDVDGTDAPRFYRELEATGVPARHVRCTLDVNPRMAAAVVRAVRAEAPDLLHTHLVHADVYGSLASRALGVPFVSTRHNDDRYLLGPFRFVDRAFARRALRLVAISNAVRRFLVESAGLPAEKVETIHYAALCHDIGKIAQRPDVIRKPDSLDEEERRLMMRHPEAGARIVGQIRQAWPEVRIILRGDSGFCREELLAWCESHRVDYVFGFARNQRLQSKILAPMREAQAEPAKKKGGAHREAGARVHGVLLPHAGELVAVAARGGQV